MRGHGKERRLERVLKEALDRVGAALGLVACAPLLAVIAVAVRATLGRPVLFRQRRPGLHGATFELLKFRTMGAGTGSDAERLTPFGRFLRSTSLDELPELWNVLRGDMSLVGPRPLLTQYLRRYTSEQMRRHAVKPGITGWAQINGRNAITWEQRFALDVWYVDHWSLGLDVRILLRTVWTTISREGVAAPGSASMPEFRGPRETETAASAPAGAGPSVHRHALGARLALYVFGAGGHGKVVAEAARAGTRYELRGFLDDDARRRGEQWDGLPVVGGREAIASLEEGAEVALGVGANRLRAELARTLAVQGRRLATIVHPTAVVASGVRLGAGTYVAPLAVLHTNARVGRACIVNSGAVVEHDCRIGDFVHVSPRAALGGGVLVDEGAHVGLGAIVLPGLRVGPWATLGAGAVVIRSLPAGVTAVGVPAHARNALGRAG